MISATIYKYLSAILLISFACLSLFSVLQQHQLKNKEETIIKLTVKVSTAFGINQDLNAKIDTQNKAVNDLSVKSSKLLKRLDAAKRDTEKLKVIYSTKVTELLNASVQNDCRSSLNWLKSKATDLR